MTESVTPREIKSMPKAYAFERALGLSPMAACRRAGGSVEKDQETKWEQNKRVQAWIVYYRSLGHTEEMMAAKRQRLDDRHMELVKARRSGQRLR
jgi:hypothetical protein